MLVRDCMNAPVVCCMPWDPVWTAAALMKIHDIGAVAVVSDLSDPLLEGIVTDRDLCCAVLFEPRLSCSLQVADIMTRVPVTCLPEDTLAECEELMRENQVRRIPVVNERGRCVGIVSQTELARYGTAAHFAATVRAIVEPPAENGRAPHMSGDEYYCGQLHEADQIALLNRRREHRSEEVLA